MKARTGFWFFLTAFFIQALTLFFRQTSSESGIIDYIGLYGLPISALVALYLGLFKRMSFKYRLLIILAGISLFFDGLKFWGYEPHFELFGFDIEGITLFILGFTTLVLGFVQTKNIWLRIFMILIVISVIAFLIGGVESLGGVGIVLIVVIALTIFFGFFAILAYGFGKAGEEDARLMREGKPPKYGPPPFGPDNPFNKK